MLGDYIKKKISEINEQIKALNEQLAELMRKEKEDEKKISYLLEHEDVGIELFSPRNPDSKVKAQVQENRRHIDELHFDQTKLTSEIEKCTEEEESWRQLLTEYEDHQETSQTIDDENKYAGQLQEILNRLIRIDNAMDRHKGDTKQQLRQLIYYVKALIAENQSS